MTDKQMNLRAHNAAQRFLRRAVGKAARIEKHNPSSYVWLPRARGYLYQFHVWHADGTHVRLGVIEYPATQHARHHYAII